jgi:putative NIF3 family GTP cyclohydrolase 1 type 2
MTTARELIDRILQRAAAQGTAEPTTPSRRDTIKVGDPDTQVTGVITTGMTTFDILKRAVAAKCNFIIPHEDTWFRDSDIAADYVEGDPIYEAKLKYARDHGLVIWRNHDLTHRMAPDQMMEGLLRQFGWTVDPGHEVSIRRLPVVTLPQPTTLEALVRDLVQRTGMHSYRVAGDPGMTVRKVAVGVGYAYPNWLIGPDIDVLVGGESAEGSDGNSPSYDLTAYAADSTALGRPRGVVLLGHMGTEDIGMQVVAEWIRSFTPEVPITYMPAGEPFARPI